MSKSIRFLLVMKKTSRLTKESKLKEILKTGSPNLKKKCKKQWRRFARVLHKTVSVSLYENSLMDTHPKFHFLVFSSSGHKDSKKLFQKVKRSIKLLILRRKRKIMITLWKNLLLCVLMNQLSQNLSEPELKLLWQSKFINVISLIL